MKTYISILQELQQRDISIKLSEYHGYAFGSWFIEIYSKPPYRLVHDGRDKTIVLEVKNKDKEWTSILADKTRSGKHVLKALLDKIESL